MTSRIVFPVVLLVAVAALWAGRELHSTAGKLPATSPATSPATFPATATSPETSPATRPTAEKVLFTFAVFGDNKGGGKILETTFRNFKRIKPSFVLGMGDHFKSKAQIRSWNASIRKVFGDTESFYKRFYLTAGDNEAQAYSGRQSNAGSERPFFHLAGLFDAKTDKPLRDTIVEHDAKWLDYYAQLHVGGVRLHLVNLYKQDSVIMHAETRAFADRVLKRIRKDYPSQPWVVFAHDGMWWRRYFKKGHALYSCDLLFGASWHRYLCHGAEGGGTNLAFNTSAVARDGKSWYAVMVLKDRFVLLNISDRAFRVQGRPGCHVKPFGQKGYAGDADKWFKLLEAYGRSVKGDWGPLPTGPKKPTTQPATRPKAKAYVVVFDFHTVADGKDGKDVKDDPAAPLAKRPAGVRLADSVRLRLRRHKEYEVIDRHTTRDFSAIVPAATNPKAVSKLMAEKLGANVAIYGTVNLRGGAVRAEVRCIDHSDPNGPRFWTQVLSDKTERARGVIAGRVVEAVTGKARWVPPQYGDEPEPSAKKFAKALNANGGFDKGAAGWDAPDNVSTFIEPGPDGRGNVLRVRTDLERNAWLAYRRRLRLGRANPKNPPKIARDTSYGSVAGVEGVHYRSEWIKATPGQRYWLVADVQGNSAGMFFPKVFVKGFRKTPAGEDGLPESSLAELGLTPKQFAQLPPEKRKELIEKDVKKHPMRHLRMCYQWYLPCRDAGRAWKHYAAPFPPRGGLPKDVEWLQIQIFSYWPPGEYLWDNVHLYKDPAQKTPLPEEPARTPGKTGEKK